MRDTLYKYDKLHIICEKYSISGIVFTENGSDEEVSEAFPDAPIGTMIISSIGRNNSINNLDFAVLISSGNNKWNIVKEAIS